MLEKEKQKCKGNSHQSPFQVTLMGGLKNFLQKLRQKKAAEIHSAAFT